MPNIYENLLEKLLPKTFKDPLILKDRDEASRLLEAINHVLDYGCEETEGYLAKLEVFRSEVIAYLQQTAAIDDKVIAEETSRLMNPQPKENPCSP